MARDNHGMTEAAAPSRTDRRELFSRLSEPRDRKSVV
jgi:hypothetical protein